MTKYRLDWEDEEDFLAIGIASHQKDFKMAWALNQVLDCQFERLSDYRSNYLNMSSFHPQFKWIEPENHYSYHLIANRGEETYLFPELKQADYLFLVKGMLDALDTEYIKHRINQSELVLTAFLVDQSKAKSVQNLILE